MKMASLTLHHVSGNTCYIPAPTCIGLYEKDGTAVLIDSGNDRDAGRQIAKLLNERGVKLELIVNTHSNADHIGGNAFLQGKTGCRIAATSLESAFINNPLLEPAFLLGGYPFSDIRNKFLMAKGSCVTDVIPSSGSILDTDLEAVPLPGHFFDMIGVRTPDDVVFIADSLFPEHIISKYHAFFLLDIRSHLETLEYLQEIKAHIFIPSHGKPSGDISRLIRINRQKIDEIIGEITAICSKPLIFDELLSTFCLRYAISIDANQYVLVSSTLRSYLSYLKDEGTVEMMFKDGKPLWKIRG
jgi:glyoxylase-like metal-dependent hydrolase (beta-lactamase superfamily II)